MRSFDCFVRFLPVSDRRELNSYKPLNKSFDTSAGQGTKIIRFSNL